MIDLHCHILPGLDDGSKSLEESLDMARLAAESGVAGIVATPHCDGADSKEVRRAVSLLRDAIKDAKIPVELFLGMEIFGTWDTLKLLKQKKLLTVNGSKYPLIEFDFYADGEETTRILREIVGAGYRPVIAHPERYEFVQKNPKILNTWNKMGCLLQVNRGSFMGRFGNLALQLAFAMVERNFAAVAASDAHSASVRTPWMRDVRELLEKEFSCETAEKLLVSNPLCILKNEDLSKAEPIWF